MEDCEGGLELSPSAVGQGREAVAVAWQARVCLYVAGFDARTTDARRSLRSAVEGWAAAQFCSATRGPRP